MGHYYKYNIIQEDMQNHGTNKSQVGIKISIGNNSVSYKLLKFFFYTDVEFGLYDAVEHTSFIFNMRFWIHLHLNNIVMNDVDDITQS